MLRTLEETEGNVTKTAEILSLERSHHYRNKKALSIGPKEA
ncbi:MAG: helix-turn-helix domain-containing protein [Bryobacter sp.]|nr:helix-turn-helix domain-containing protein [Bryobacter sp.]